MSKQQPVNPAAKAMADEHEALRLKDVARMKARKASQAPVENADGWF